MDAMGGILTKGLGHTACTHLILGPLRLHCGDVPHVEGARGGGGYSVRRGSEAARIIHRLTDREYEEPQEYIRKKQISIAFSVNDKTYGREFIVRPDTARTIVKIVKWINKTKQSFTVRITKFLKKSDGSSNN